MSLQRVTDTHRATICTYIRHYKSLNMTAGFFIGIFRRSSSKGLIVLDDNYIVFVDISLPMAGVLVLRLGLFAVPSGTDIWLCSS